MSTNGWNPVSASCWISLIVLGVPFWMTLLMKSSCSFWYRVSTMFMYLSVIVAVLCPSTFLTMVASRSL